MKLRDARPADAEAIAAVARASWHGAYDGLLGAETVDATVDRWYDPDSLRDAIRDAAVAGSDQNDESAFLVAERDGAVVGFANAGATDQREGDREPSDAFLSRLYVHPDHWSAGVGTALTARVARRLRDAGYERVWLEVFAENERAREFYGALGFERVGSEREQFGGTDVTTLHLETAVRALVAATEAA